MVVSVADNGRGFDPQYADRILEPFQRIDVDGGPRGTGLGLAIVKRVMERHGGEVRLAGEPGVGATVELLFPSRLVDDDR